MNSDGSGQRKLAVGCCLDWSPDGEKLAFIVHERVSVVSVYVVNADGSSLRRVSPRGDVRPDVTGHFDHPDWSPDGQKLVYMGSDGIYSVRIDGTSRRQLTPASGYDAGPVWSADGRTIAFERWGSRQTAARRTIYVMNADGSDERRLVPGGGHSSPVWAPNRPTLAFIRFDDSGRHLALINANGSGLRTLTKGPVLDNSPAWSPSGRKIAFSVSRFGSPRGDVHVINRDGSRKRNLTRVSRTDDFSPSWSVDGKRIAFMRANQNDVMDIYVMTATGQQQTNVTQSPRGTVTFDPAWSPARR